MYKMRVKEVSKLGHYRLTTGEVGFAHPKNHPRVIYDAFFWQRRESMIDIEIGDLLRCDGLPYLSRPRPVYRTVEDTVLAKGVYCKLHTKVKDYVPFKLKSGYWVLRKVS